MILSSFPYNGENYTLEPPVSMPDVNNGKFTLGHIGAYALLRNKTQEQEIDLGVVERINGSDRALESLISVLGESKVKLGNLTTLDQQ